MNGTELQDRAKTGMFQMGSMAVMLYTTCSERKTTCCVVKRILKTEELSSSSVTDICEINNRAFYLE